MNTCLKVSFLNLAAELGWPLAVLIYIKNNDVVPYQLSLKQWEIVRKAAPLEMGELIDKAKKSQDSRNIKEVLPLVFTGGGSEGISNDMLRLAEIYGNGTGNKLELIEKMISCVS